MGIARSNEEAAAATPLTHIPSLVAHDVGDPIGTVLLYPWHVVATAWAPSRRRRSSHFCVREKGIAIRTRFINRLGCNIMLIMLFCSGFGNQNPCTNPRIAKGQNPFFSIWREIAQKMGKSLFLSRFFFLRPDKTFKLCFINLLHFFFPYSIFNIYIYIYIYIP